AHRLVKRGDDVVVLLARLVVEERALLNRLLDAGDVDAPDAVLAGRGRHAQLQQVQRHAGVAVRVQRDGLDRVLVDGDLLVAEPAIAVGQGAPQNGRDFVDLEAAQHEHLGSRQQRRGHLEGRVLRRRADEDDVAGFDARQERVLLRFVEAMDLVDEDNRPPAGGLAHPLGFGHDLADFLDARQHGAERDEARLRHIRDDAREGGLAGAWRSPQDDRLDQIAIDGVAQRPARGQQIFLADELGYREQPHTVGERRRRTRRGGGFVGIQGVHQREDLWRLASYTRSAVAAAVVSESAGV